MGGGERTKLKPTRVHQTRTFHDMQCLKRAFETQKQRNGHCKRLAVKVK